MGEVVERVRLVAVNLLRHRQPFAGQLRRVEFRGEEGVAEEGHRLGEVVGSRGDEVIHVLGVGGGVGQHPQCPHPRVVGVRVRQRPVGFEEHVLVEVAHAVEVRRLRHRAILHSHLHGDERRARHLHHHHVQPVGQGTREDGRRGEARLGEQQKREQGVAVHVPWGDSFPSLERTPSACSNTRIAHCVMPLLAFLRADEMEPLPRR